VIGAVLGAILAIKIQMTAMPQLVALFNGFGGAASVLIVSSELVVTIQDHGITDLPAVDGISIAASAVIGAVTFCGSMVAFAKLQELRGLDLRFGGQQLVNAALAIAAVGLAVWVVIEPNMTAFWILIAVASVLGVTSTSAIGGADMPVVIALLNSYSGLAAAATGFVLGNNVLIIAGSLVGASGLILTSIMCKAMNRSLANVLFGGMAAGNGASADEVYGGKVKSTSADEVAIHPVAGRMPGHMNVLLAEADVPYEQLKEMDVINPTLTQADVAIVIGANDVVNPVARTDPQSPIAGMPIIDVDKARTVVVVKRSLSPGFAGIPNPLFAADNTLMLFGDAKKAMMDVAAAVKEG